jgi:hypothetical protein
MENRKPWRQQSGGHPQHVENSWACDGRRSHIGLAWSYSKRTKTATNAVSSSRICSMESRGGTLLCRKRSALRKSKAVSVLGIAGASWAASTGGSVAVIPSQNTARFRPSLSVRRKSPTSVWRRSISSTRKTSEHRRPGYNLFEEAAAADTAAAVSGAAAAADTAAAEAVLAEAAAAAGEAAAAAAAAGAGAGAAAACHGEVAPPGARLEHLPITLTDAGRQQALSGAANLADVGKNNLAPAGRSCPRLVVLTPPFRRDANECKVWA